MAKYKLAFKKNPMKKDEPGKWYANPSVVNRMDTRAVCKVVTRNTTTAPTELESAFNLVCDGIPHELQQGNSVRLGELGTLRLSFGSAGVSSPELFDAATMMKNVKVIFTPSKELLSAVKNGLSFENVGIVEEGFSYPSLKAYQEYKVAARKPGQGGDGQQGGSGEGSGGSDGDQSENPLG
ncbi:HU family DNA-binding protein [Bacteroides sp. GD17]|jgi:predicted histone-like DNA-binding protein|uniref:HU family DNA-binding protein n=1 Tax=Bacteroides sp. GD17 TaxID=3139826 RepID=UPI0025FCD699|nr:HU family DNA-binding protein [uncultured Bacteroides sp.]